MVGVRFALLPFAQGAHGLAAAASRPLSLFPLIRGCTPLYASPYGKGRCHGVTEGIRKSVFDMANRNAGINPQKGRHLLCTFCPYEMRSMSRKGRELCPMGTKREGKLRFSGVCRAHAVVSPLNFSAEFSLLLFCPAKEKQRNGDVWGGVTK